MSLHRHIAKTSIPHRFGFTLFLTLPLLVMDSIPLPAEQKKDSAPMPTSSSPPRPEYPRPDFVRAEWLNLNGAWDFEFDPGQSGEERGLAEKPFSQTIQVPFCPESALSGIGHKDFMPCVWYRRAFQIPPEWKGKRILLHFGAVDYEATVWVNGTRAGEHRGGFTPFCFDITPLLREGENRLVVRAVDDPRSPLQARGKQSTKYESYGCFYTRTTGIWQTVWLEPVADTYLKSCRVIPDFSGGRFTFYAQIEGPTRGATLSVRVLAEGIEVVQAKAPASPETILSVAIPKARAWQPADPFLYDVVFRIEKAASVVDEVKCYAGMREIRIEGKKVLLNGKPVFQRLVLDQGFYPTGIYTAPSDAELRADIERSMAMGFNGARLHQKVFEPRFLYWADRLGYLVWGEYPNWGLDHANPAILPPVLLEWMEAIERDFNHPAIIGWCPFNETPGNQSAEVIRAVYRATKQMDPTRPVIDTSGYIHVETDIYDCHNYEQDPAVFAATFEEFKNSEKAWRNYPDHDAPYRGQPYFVSEYGGMAWDPAQAETAGWGYGNRPKTEAEYIERYRALTQSLLAHPNMFAFCFTQLYDVEQEVNGLYTYDRRAKFDPAIIHAINTPLAAIEQ